MKQICYIMTLVLLACTTVFAQPGKGRNENIKKIKMDFIAGKIHLTEAQRATFWPVYNQYEQEMRAIRKSYRQQYKDKENANGEAHSRKMIEDNLQYQEEELNLKKKYKNEMLKVISAKQLADLYVAEREFKKMLMEELRERRGNHDQQKR